jgi:hypothetical protein
MGSFAEFVAACHHGFQFTWALDRRRFTLRNHAGSLFGTGAGHQRHWDAGGLSRVRTALGKTTTVAFAGRQGIEPRPVRKRYSAWAFVNGRRAVIGLIVQRRPLLHGCVAASWAHYGARVHGRIITATNPPKQKTPARPRRPNRGNRSHPHIPPSPASRSAGRVVGSGRPGGSGGKVHFEDIGVGRSGVVTWLPERS